METPESKQHEPGDQGGPEGTFALERVEHETRGTFEPEGATSEELEPEKAFVPEPEADESGKDSSDDESEPELDQGGQSGAYQEAPAAVRKPYHSFIGAPQPITQSRARSGRDAASLQAPMRAVDDNHLPQEPTTLYEAQASPEWPNWQRARKSEMDEQLARQTSIRMVLGIAAVKDWEFRQLDVDMAYLEAGVEEEPYIEQPEDYRDSCDQVGRLQEAMYGLVHAELLRSKTFSAELAARGFEQCQTDPCVFRRVLRGRVVIIIVVYVDDLLMASETKRNEEQAMKDLRSCFPIKDLGEAGLYLGCHITRDRDAGTLKLDQHRYVRTVASKFNVEKTSTTPAAAGANPCSRTTPYRPRRKRKKCVSPHIGRR